MHSKGSLAGAWANIHNDDQLLAHSQASRIDVMNRLTAGISTTVPAYCCTTARKGAGSVQEISQKGLDFL